MARKIPEIHQRVDRILAIRLESRTPLCYRNEAPSRLGGAFRTRDGTMTKTTVCIGSALWDVIGHSDGPMSEGFDRPGRISRHPGGVAFNVAAALVKAGVTPTMLTAIGNDPDGDALVAAMVSGGIDCAYTTRVDRRTDMYMAIEHEGSLFGAVADCASLEAAGNSIFTPLVSGALTKAPPFDGFAIIDGNLPVPVLEAAANSGVLASARVLFVPASPGKAKRMTAVLQASGATLCVNRFEAEIICDTTFTTAIEASAGLAALACSAIVTDGNATAAYFDGNQTYTTVPPKVDVLRVTGAGDAFLAGFVAAEMQGADPLASLEAAAATAAKHISEPKLDL